MRSILVADTGVVFAAMVRSEPLHDRCASLLRSECTTVIPTAVLVEVGLLGRSRGRPDAASWLLQSVIDESILTFEPDLEDYRRIHELVVQYADLPLDAVDASVIVTAERLEQDTIATLDRRHFSVVRPRNVPAFRLVPELDA